MLTLESIRNFKPLFTNEHEIVRHARLFKPTDEIRSPATIKKGAERIVKKYAPYPIKTTLLHFIHTQRFDDYKPLHIAFDALIEAHKKPILFAKAYDLAREINGFLFAEYQDILLDSHDPRNNHEAITWVKEKAESICEELNIPYISKKANTQKLLHAAWWQKRIERQQLIEAEEIKRRFRLIKSYTSYEVKKHFTNIDNNPLLSAEEKEKREAHKENKHRRERAKTEAKIEGLANYAIENSLDVTFITITLKDHSQSASNALESINDSWHKTLKAINKKGLSVAGSFTIEPHASGFPHVHIWACSNSYDMDLFIRIIQDKFMPHTFTINEIKWFNDESEEAIKATLGYTCKSSRNKFKRNSKDDYNVHVDSWYWLYNVKRSRFFGLPCDSLFEASRRLTRSHISLFKEIFTNNQRDKYIKLLLGIRSSARKGDYATWLNYVGGIGRQRLNRIIESVVRTYNFGGSKNLGISFKSVKLIVCSVVCFVEYGGQYCGAGKVKTNNINNSSCTSEQEKVKISNPHTAPPLMTTTIYALDDLYSIPINKIEESSRCIPF